MEPVSIITVILSVAAGAFIRSKLKARQEAAQQQVEVEAQQRAKREAQPKSQRKTKREARQHKAEPEAQRKAKWKAVFEAQPREAEVKKHRISYNPERTYLTKEEEVGLRQELNHLIKVRRPAFTQALKDASGRESKVKKNADHHYIKDQQGWVEQRIRYIETTLKSAIIVKDNGPSDRVEIGSTVIIREDGTNEDEEYKIVGVATANSRERIISSKSPIGSALLGKQKGSRVRVSTPDGLVKFKIVDVQ